MTLRASTHFGGGVGLHVPAKPPVLSVDVLTGPTHVLWQ